MSTFRAFGRQPGMQVHAVPEAERAFDNSGRRLPWGYERSDRAYHPNSSSNKDSSSSSSSQQATVEAIEKGPFGKSTRRRRGTSRSRSKTAEMMGKRETEEEKVSAENAAREDMVFGKLARRAEPTTSSGEGGKDGAEGNTAAAGAGAGSARLPTTAIDGLGEPTEVLLWGYGHELQWAAIDFYERASCGGAILEDYDRTAPHQRFAEAARSFARRGTATASLSRAALRKRNQFAGGEHWIKVTFDSRQAAEVACARSPHVVHGYVVAAELWRGVGPARDLAIGATEADMNGSSPGSSSRTFGAGGFGGFGERAGSPGRSSSRTMTSATVTNEVRGSSARGLEEEDVDDTLRPLPWQQQQQQQQQQQPMPVLPQPSSSTALAPVSASAPPTLRTRGKLSGITITQPLPAEAALVPRKPSPLSSTNTLLGWIVWLLTFQWVLVVIGAGGDGWLIGSTVPKKDEDGSFDWDKAGYYWRFWQIVDQVLGSDLCGLRGD